MFSTIVAFQYTFQKEARIRKYEGKLEEVVLNTEFTLKCLKNTENILPTKQKEGQNNIAALFSIADLEMESEEIRVTIPSEINKVELEKNFLNSNPI